MLEVAELLTDRNQLWRVPRHSQRLETVPILAGLEIVLCDRKETCGLAHEYVMEKSIWFT